MKTPAVLLITLTIGMLLSGCLDNNSQANKMQEAINSEAKLKNDPAICEKSFKDKVSDCYYQFSINGASSIDKCLQIPARQDLYSVRGECINRNAKNRSDCDLITSAAQSRAACIGKFGTSMQDCELIEAEYQYDRYDCMNKYVSGLKDCNRLFDSYRYGDCINKYATTAKECLPLKNSRSSFHLTDGCIKNHASSLEDCELIGSNYDKEQCTYLVEHALPQPPNE